MLISMTGYGRAECDLPGILYSIEIRSLNSKQLDTSLKLPIVLKEKEMEIRSMLNNQLTRGKIEFGIFQELKEGSSSYSINQPVVRDYIRTLRKIASDVKMEDTERILQVAMRLPDAMNSRQNDLGEEDWKKVKQSIQKALDELQSFRLQEGKALEEDIQLRVKTILRKLEEIEPFEKDRIPRVRQKIEAGLRNLEHNASADPGRMEQEMIFYLEKMDITEEKVRLDNHCKFFLETIKSRTSEGKKLGFISQEMGREINTIGSKASDSDIQRLVVEMKDELEKIKEQLLNVL